MITKEDLVPGTVFRGFENCHHGTHKEDLMVLASVDRATVGTVIEDWYKFIFLPSGSGHGFGGEHQHGMVQLTLDECLDKVRSLERVGTFQEAFQKMGWVL